MEVVVWARKNDYRGAWTPYPPEVSNGIEQYYSANKSAFQSRSNNLTRIQFGPFSPEWVGFSLDIALMKQCQVSSGRRFEVDRFTQGNSSALGKGFVWEFEGDTPSNWFTYDLCTMDHLEDADVKMKKRRSKSKKAQPLLDMSRSYMPYIFDVEKLIQTRKDTGKVRNIRRRPLTQPYMPDTSRQSSYSSATNSHANATAQGATSSSRLKKRKTTSGGGTSPQATPTTTQSSTATAQQSNTSTPAAGGPAQQPSAASAGKKKGKWKKQQGAKASPRAQERVSLPKENKIRINTKKHKAKSAEEVLDLYVKVVSKCDEDESNDDSDTDKEESEEQQNEDCCICCDKLREPSGYGEGGADAHVVVQLKRCCHKFHRLCLLEMYKSTQESESLQCPSCKLIYGEKTGNCPAGLMTWAVLTGSSVAGYEGYDTISVTYNILPGVQGPEHPNPGQPYHTMGFPRVGYLPDSNEGREVLKLMIEAWRRRLMFTVGTSYTTGISDTVTWNEIHHKTELYGNHSGHGYPDPAYLANVVLELANHGVTMDCL